MIVAIITNFNKTDTNLLKLISAKAIQSIFISALKQNQLDARTYDLVISALVLLVY